MQWRSNDTLAHHYIVVMNLGDLKVSTDELGKPNKNGRASWLMAQGSPNNVQA